jgi:3-hydroxyisobutyrate dehydrogenase-like beta-hydroxyacid dehydrogenase
MRIENIGFIGLGAMGSVMAPLLGQSDIMFLDMTLVQKLKNQLGLVKYSH